MASYRAELPPEIIGLLDAPEDFPYLTPARVDEEGYEAGVVLARVKDGEAVRWVLLSTEDLDLDEELQAIVLHIDLNDPKEA